MPRPLTPEERETFLAETRVATLSVASDDDRPPLTVPVWYAYEPGGDLSFYTYTATRKTRLIERAGVLTMSVHQGDEGLKYVTVEGTVVGVHRPPTAGQMLAVVRRYMPEEQAQGFVAAELAHPKSKIVLYTIRPDRWSAMDFSV